MGGGLINILTFGADDLYLTGAPQITFFKLAYRRYTNFSKESIAIPLGNINFGSEIQLEIQKTGDLISNTYLQLQIPAIQILKTDTATNLTAYQSSVLETPYPRVVPTGQPNFTNDYITVTNFMAVNMAGYRNAVSASTIKNQTVIQYINSILDTIQASATIPEIIQNYDMTISNALTYELNNIQNNQKQIALLKAQLAPNKNNTSIVQQIAVLSATNTQIFKYVSALDYKFSDISYILNVLLTNINQNNNTIAYGFINSATITINDVLTIVKNAVTTSQQVMNYYFVNVRSIQNQNTELASQYAKFAWVAKLGHAIIDYITVQIGGEIIDTHYGQWIDIWYELTSSKDQQLLYYKMIGNVNEMITYDRDLKPQYTLYIPLSFWFCRKSGLAFPIVALQFNKFYVFIKLKKVEDCAYIEPLPTVDQMGNPIDFTNNALQLTDIFSNLNLTISGNLLVDFVYLESQERRRFAQSAHEYLIETIDFTTETGLIDNKQFIELNFQQPSKELIWVAQKTGYINNYNSNLKSLWGNYSTNATGTLNPFTSAQLTFNTYERFSTAERDYAQFYFDTVPAYAHHTNIPQTRGINLYSFSLLPEEQQPSGACNFTRIPFPNMNFQIDNTMFTYKLSDVNPNIVPNSSEDTTLTTEINITIYTRKINILRIINGMAAFAYY